MFLESREQHWTKKITLHIEAGWSSIGLAKTLAGHFYYTVLMWRLGQLRCLYFFLLERRKTECWWWTPLNCSNTSGCLSWLSGKSPSNPDEYGKVFSPTEPECGIDSMFIKMFNIKRTNSGRVTMRQHLVCVSAEIWGFVFSKHSLSSCSSQ